MGLQSAERRRKMYCAKARNEVGRNTAKGKQDEIELLEKKMRNREFEKRELGENKLCCREKGMWEEKEQNNRMEKIHFAVYRVFGTY